MSDTLTSPADTIKKQHLVLVVDDLPSNLLFFDQAITGFGYSTITAQDGREALEKIQKASPDLILSDINMPGMNGYEVCEQVKSNSATRDIPIILVTAQEDRDSLVRGLNIGADDFLIKPVNVSELQARVKNLLLVKDYRDHMKRYTAELETEVGLRTRQLNDALNALQEVNLQLKDSTLDTIHRLSTAAEFRDHATAMHLWRMSYYAEALGKRMGLDPEFCERLLYASPMHDVGKIGTPDHILRKPGSFDPDELVIMRDHTIIGEQILGNSNNPLILMARDIAGGHHEWWNGEGYPRQKSGEKIPLSARIVAVADVYDALTTKRVYKDAWTSERAFEHLKENAGTHFDPESVDVFLKARDEILAIQREQPGEDSLK